MCLHLERVILAMNLYHVTLDSGQQVLTWSIDHDEPPVSTSDGCLGLETHKTWHIQWKIGPDILKVVA